MGLLDTSYSAVNTKKPRKSDRILPATELNARGLLDAATNVPIAGDALSGVLAAYDAAKGDYGSAAVNALGVLPFVSGTFIGKGAKTWDAVKAAEAAKRIDAGENAAKVWKETGYGKAPWDKAARSEIDDSKAEIGKYAKESMVENGFKGPAAQAIWHKQLYESYPDLKNIDANFSLGNRNRGNYGSDDSMNVEALGFDSAKSVGIHEMQHAIQQREKFARGGSSMMAFNDPVTYDIYKEIVGNISNPMSMKDYAKQAWGSDSITQEIADDYKQYAKKAKSALTPEIDRAAQETAGKEYYKRLAGEAEARLTQARMNLTPEQRLAQYPYDPEYFKQATGVDINNLIVRGDGGTAMSLLDDVRPMTEYEKRHEIARQNAVKMLGLPENNTAMDRARAMGAERVYHGSRSPEGVVKDGLIPGGANGASRSGDAYGVGVYTTTSPSEASSAVYTGENGAVFPLMIMRDNHLNIDNPSRGELEKLTNFAQDSLLPSDKARFSIGRDVREFDSVDDARDFFENQKANWKQFGDGMERAKQEVISNEGGKFKIEFTNFDAPISINNGDEANTLLKAVGYDSVPSMGFSGHTMNRQSGNTWDVTNDTSKLRSVFAAFDPAKRYSNDLMGYADPRLLGLIGGGGLLGLGAYKANQE